MIEYTRVAAFDVSLTATGWAEFDVTLSRLSYGICPPCKVNGLERMSHVLQFVKAKVDREALVLIEDFSFGSKGQALSEIHGLGYLIRYWLWQQGIRYLAVAPSALKKWCCGKGNAQKDIMIREVYSRWDLKIDDNNICDAVALNYLGQALIGQWEPTTDFQRAVVRDVNKKYQNVLGV